MDHGGGPSDGGVDGDGGGIGVIGIVGVARGGSRCAGGRTGRRRGVVGVGVRVSVGMGLMEVLGLGGQELVVEDCNS